MSRSERNSGRPKDGVLKAAGVLAGSAARELRRLIAVRLRAEDDPEDDLPTLRAMLDYLKEEEQKKRDYKLDPDSPKHVVILTEALDHALEMIGRTGKEVLFAILEERYGLGPTDIVTRPGQFMSALQHLLGNSALVIETDMLLFIKEKRAVRGWSLEDAVDKLKAADQEPGSKLEP